MTNNSKVEFIVALDIGTTKVLCLVADYDEDGNLRIVGVGQEACKGLNKGVISEISTTVSSIRKAKEQARIILPLNQYTEVYWTASFQAVMNFIELRNEKTSQWEIQEYAKSMLDLIHESFPKTTEIWADAHGWK